MGKIVATNLPCLDTVRCKSSDAMRQYDDGTYYCFSCEQYFKSDGEKRVSEEEESGNQKKPSVDEVSTYITRGMKDRKVLKVVCEFYGVKMSFGADGEPTGHFYPYSNGGFKQRRLPKTFTWIGTKGGLFGKDKFNGGGKRIIITEGEIDALSIATAYYEKYQKIYPVVSIPSAVEGQSDKELIANREWLRSFEEILLCFDNDEPGIEATQRAIRILGIDKVRLVKLTGKDPNDVLVQKGWNELLQCVWDAAPWSPAGIIGKDAIWNEIVARNHVVAMPYPDCLYGVNTKLKGMRDGEIVLFISGTGSGKSTVMREIIIHAVQQAPDEKVGVISLEESPGETGIKLAGMAIYRNTVDEVIPDEELKVGFDKLFGRDQIMVLDHQGAIKDASIIDQLEYMALMGCKKIIIDHITILVSEGADGLTGNEAIDKIMNDLLRVVKKHNIWVGLVSHLRKTGVGGKSFEEGYLPSLDDIRGSGSIKQVSFDIVAFARNMTHEDEAIRNEIIMAVLKARTTGKTGPVSGAKYNPKTGRLEKVGGFEPAVTEVIPPKPAEQKKEQSNDGVPPFGDTIPAVPQVTAALPVPPAPGERPPKTADAAY